MTETIYNTQHSYMQLRFLAKSAFDNATAAVEDYIYLYDNFNEENPVAVLIDDQPEFINRQTICVGILKGQVDIVIDGHPHVMKGGCFCYVSAHCLCRFLSMAPDTQFFCFSVNQDLMLDVYRDMGITFKMPSRYKKFVCRQLPASDMLYRKSLYKELYTELNRVAPDYQKHVAQAYLCIIYSNDFELFEEDVPDSSRAISKQHALFRDFVELLGQYSNQEREVQFYARQMGITPKYLSALCIEYSGKNASSWIDDYVISRVKVLMQENRYNIKEIAQVMHFPTQSFFGRYFKRVTGKSPRQYMISNGL